jgi:hypothetical protein
MGKGGKIRRKQVRDKADYAVKHGLGERRVLAPAEADELFRAINRNQSSVFSISLLAGVNVDYLCVLPHCAGSSHPHCNRGVEQIFVTTHLR